LAGFLAGINASNERDSDNHDTAQQHHSEAFFDAEEQQDQQWFHPDALEQPASDYAHDFQEYEFARYDAAYSQPDDSAAHACTQDHQQADESPSS
jgi:hypothetical protein